MNPALLDRLEDLGLDLSQDDELLAAVNAGGDSLSDELAARQADRDPAEVTVEDLTAIRFRTDEYAERMNVRVERHSNGTWTMSGARENVNLVAAIQRTLYMTLSKRPSASSSRTTPRPRAFRSVRRRLTSRSRRQRGGSRGDPDEPEPPGGRPDESEGGSP